MQKTDLVRHLPTDLRGAEAVQSLLNDPLSTVAAMITGALAAGHQGLTLAGGHIVQAVIGGRAFKQLGEELDELLKKGKIRSDYAETKYGFASLVELMKTIDSDATDEDKLRASKVMFVALNSPTTPQKQEALRYQLFRIVLALSGPQVALLIACHTLVVKGTWGASNSGPLYVWFAAIGELIGHNVTSLIEQDEKALMARGLLDERGTDRGSVAVNLRMARLTDLGIKVAELIQTYSADIDQAAVPKS